MSKIDPKADRERILDCIKLGERMSPHFVMDLLEALEGERAHVALLKASLKQATETEQAALARVAELEGALRKVEGFGNEGPRRKPTSIILSMKLAARAALSSTERMPSDGG
jgi:hypothetical protein